MTLFNSILFNLLFITLVSSQKVVAQEYSKECDSLIIEYKLLHKEFKKRHQISKKVFYKTIISLIQNSCSCKYVNSSTLNLFHTAISSKGIKNYIQAETINDLKFKLLKEYNKRFKVEEKHHKFFNIYESPTKESLMIEEKAKQISTHDFNEDMSFLFEITPQEEQEIEELQIIESRGYGILLWLGIKNPTENSAGGGVKLTYSDHELTTRDFEKLAAINQMQIITSKEYEKAIEQYFDELKEKADIYSETNRQIKEFIVFFP